MTKLPRLALLASIVLAASPAVAAGSFNGPATVIQPLTVNHCLKVQSTGSNALVDAGVGCGSGSPVGANPTATIGATAVNGTSPDFMRSDAAPALPSTLPALNGSLLTNLNATALASGTVAAARGGAGTVNGALKGNGSGAVSQAACADLSNDTTSCSTANDTAATASTLAKRDASGNLTGATLFAITTPTTWANNQTCTAGQITWDANFIYVCTTTNTVKRAALSTF